MRSQPHTSVCWALTAWHLQEDTLSFRGTQSSDLVVGITEVYIRYIATELIREIELFLKKRLHSLLVKLYGSEWWSNIPKCVRSNAKARHRWSITQIGSRRAGRVERMEWLSFGDVIVALGDLSTKDWRYCLCAETARKRGFEKTVRRIKAFRDNSLAHPRTRWASNADIILLCRSIRKIPLVLCPYEWQRVLDILELVWRLEPHMQLELAWEANPSLRKDHKRYEEWLRFSDLSPPELCSHSDSITHAEVRWRDNILRECSAIDAGRRVLFHGPEAHSNVHEQDA